MPKTEDPQIDHTLDGSVAVEEAEMKPEIFLPEDYRPAEDEPFMNERQLEYFRRKLNAWKTEIIDLSAETIAK
jgi:DnaK suppressor protein